MLKRLYYVASVLLAAIVLSASAATSTTSSSATPTLFSVRGAPQVLADGAQKLYPVTIDESQAFSAIFKGGMWLPNPAGGREYARYARHLIHDDGDWTFIGKVPTAHGDQSVVITFGKDAVFGIIKQMSGYPLRLVTAHGHTSLMQTSGDMLGRSPTALALRANQDFKIPLRRARSAVSPSGTSAATQSSAQQQTASPTVDVMVAYTAGFVSEYGTVSAALTRINNLVDITNQAYVDSQVNQQIRLVHTVQVSYPDNNSNNTALDDITGNDGTKPVPIPSSLQAIAGLRAQYGADLVSLVRSFDNATDGGCGVGWLIGAALQPIVPSQDYVFGYSVVSDGSDAGYYCLDSTFAHELGHNMGNAHDRAHASKDGNGNPIPGAYSYSFGYLGNGTDGFSTIMAYGSATDTPLDLFSNPNISICQSTPCGVADNSPSSADNAHSLSNTASLIAQFEPTRVNPSGHAHNDFNGDGMSDLLFYNPSPARAGWWLMNGATVLSTAAQGVSSAWHVATTGDFNGDGKTDIVWTDAANNVYIWMSTGTGFTAREVSRYAAGWTPVGAGDVDGDGKADLLFYNASIATLGWWVMNGASITAVHTLLVGNSGLRVAAIGDFNGDGKADVVWTDASRNVYIWLSTGSGFDAHWVSAYASGWQLVGAGDVDGDGKADLLFYNASPAALSWWTMNGSSIQSIQRLGVIAGPRVVSVGDLNGDGKSDVVWKDSANTLYLWTSTGSSFTAQTMSGIAQGWVVLP